MPTINTVLNTITYNTKRYFNLRELIQYMEEMTILSEQIQRDFDEIYKYNYLKSCAKTIGAQ